MQLDPEALAESTRVYFEDLRPLALGDEFTAFLMETALDYRALEAASPEYRAYAEAYIDLHRLIEEIRFEAALAVLLLVEYRAKRDRGEAPRVTETIEIPVEAAALIRGYFRDPPSPGESPSSTPLAPM